MNHFRTGWYVLYTRPKHEKKVAVQLEDQQLEYYLPLLRMARNWADRVKLVHAPMFPSYVFIHLKQLSDYFAALNLDGVLQYVKFGGHVARVGDAVIHNLKLVSEYGQQVEVSFSEFKQGEVMTISEGPFSGMSCEVVQYKNEEKILVRLSLLQRNLLMQVPASQLVRL
jgi:transcriptional antiterminator RfaH